MSKSSKNKLIVGMAARMTSDKRQDLLIDMVHSYKKFFNEKKIFFSLIGVGVSLKKHRRHVVNSGLEKIITLPGYLDEKNIIRWFKNLDIYIHISDDETTSTSILQAMSMSLPIICSDVDGNKMLNKNNNLLIVPNNKKKIFSKLKYLLNNQKLRKYLGKNSRKIVETQYNAENLFEKYLKFIFER